MRWSSRSSSALRATAGVAAAGAGNMMPLDARRRMIAGFPPPWTAPGAATPAHARALRYYRSRPATRKRSACGCARAACSPTPTMPSGTRRVDRQRGIRAPVSAAADPVGYRFEQQADAGSASDRDRRRRARTCLKDGNDRKPQPEMLPARARPGGDSTGDFELVIRHRRPRRRRRARACARSCASWRRPPRSKR